MDVVRKVAFGCKIRVFYHNKAERQHNTDGTDDVDRRDAIVTETA